MSLIRLPSSLRVKLVDELERAGTREIGGVLMGEQLKPGDFRVVDLTVQRSGGSLAAFVRTVKSAWNALGQFFDRTSHEYVRFNYLGDWHSHPSFSVSASPTDHSTMLDLVQDTEVGATFAVLLIVKLKGRALEASATLFFPSGRSEAADLLFESDYD